MTNLVIYSVYVKYFSKMLLSIKMIFSKKLSIVLSIPIMISIYSLSNIQKAIILLGIFFAFDFITGILASYFEKKKAEKTDPSLKQVSLISSEKLKLSMVKAFTYCSSILSIYGIEKVFFVKQFEWSVVEQKLSVTMIAIAFCCIIELYSIFFENFKRMGFDLGLKIKTISNKIVKIKSQISSIFKTDNNDTSE